MMWKHELVHPASRASFISLLAGWSWWNSWPRKHHELSCAWSNLKNYHQLSWRIWMIVDWHCMMVVEQEPFDQDFTPHITILIYHIIFCLATLQDLLQIGNQTLLFLFAHWLCPVDNFLEQRRTALYMYGQCSFLLLTNENCNYKNFHRFNFF